MTLSPDLLVRLAARIQAKTEKQGDCLIWTGTLNGPADSARYGYGLVGYQDGPVYRRVVTHSVMYQHLVGPIPDGFVLDHECRRHACWSPDHLEPVTRRENTLRGIPYWDLNTHCRYGHEYTAENTYTPPGQARRRYCKECHRRWSREFYHRHKEAAGV